MRLLLVLVGGAAGSGARYLVSTWVAGRVGAAFPWGTLLVNVAGSFVIGLIATLADEAGSVGPDSRLLLVTGFLGGFTTFSSFSLESLRLAEQRELVRATLNVVGSIVIAFGAALAGIVLGRALER